MKDGQISHLPPSDPGLFLPDNLEKVFVPSVFARSDPVRIFR